MWNTLPNITGSCARGADPIGGFGQVTGGITNPYQVSILGLILPRVAFTNLYHRDGGLGVIDCYNVLGTVIDCGESPT
jgi:hypothetical protein